MSVKSIAREVIKDFNLRYPLDIYEFCDQLNIKIYRENIDMDGCLICHKGRAAIIVNQNHTSREKFSIAHELGHFFIPHHNELMFSCYDVGNSSVITKIENEREADEFASELLLPENLVKKYAEDLTILKVLEVANIYGTSLLCSAVRLIKLTEDNAILIYWTSNHLKWHIWSDSGFMQLNTNYDFSNLLTRSKVKSSHMITNDDEIEFVSTEIYSINKTDKLILIKEYY